MKSRLSKEKILNKLNTFLTTLGQEVNNKTQYLNCGGCCVYAYLIGKYLIDTLPFLHVGIKVVDRCIDEDTRLDLNKLKHKIDNNSPFEWEHNGVTFSHVIVMYGYKKKRFICDSNIVEEYSDRVYFKGDLLYTHKGWLSVKEAKEISDDVDYWNSAFNRNQIPRIEDIIKENFERFKQEIYI